MTNDVYTHRHHWQGKGPFIVDDFIADVVPKVHTACLSSDNAFYREVRNAVERLQNSQIQDVAGLNGEESGFIERIDKEEITDFDAAFGAPTTTFPWLMNRKTRISYG